jgi:hypothetical protein
MKGNDDDYNVGADAVPYDDDDDDDDKLVPKSVDTCHEYRLTT